MKIVIVGLGKMGSQIALRLQDHGHEVAGIEADPGMAKMAADKGLTVLPVRADVLRFFDDSPVVLWLMIPAGVVTHELAEWLSLVPAGSTIIDGGNSDFRMTRDHAATAAKMNIHFVDVGTSGGIFGLEQGFCLMIGGEAAAVKPLEPLFKSLAEPRGAYQHFGPTGAGHYVKMVHNAIEYGMMESLAEGYHLLQAGPYEGLDLPHIAQLWQHGSIVESKLNGLVAVALKDSPTLADVDGYVAESGEARWALEVAHKEEVPMPAIQKAHDVRLASEAGDTNFATKLLAALRNRFGGHTVNRPSK